MLAKEGKGGRLVAFGGAGSNQCVALPAHASRHGIETGMLGTILLLASPELEQ
jgi:hypothetical protein